ncbi:ATPase [Mycobacterium sp. 852013-51886_SCH5428379]|uniref:SRPBCC family protein n=1 Tax=Mycobacterium sp. 852013-51886_SCH5428379 TaxID=1834111 RepID=UPI0007FE505C|nr:SRPBCC domain-containing protein [Mycobacterium sp. 852013-51886_SCH5428379]OBB62228.1 ATPase [Mycobacterium sp. 852013-51886_SCH5428379]
MPIRRDDGRRWVEVEYLVPGTPEQVWDAIATGAGMSAWFAPTTVDEREGGALEFDFGDGRTQRGVITGWDPPNRLTYEEQNWSDNGSPGPLATEVTVTGRSGHRCVVRMVHSLFTDVDDWDDEIEGFESGWPGAFEVLRVYLRDFAGQPAAPVRLMAECPDTPAAGWSQLARGLGLAGVDAGERVESPHGAPDFAGVVERVYQRLTTREVMVRLDRPATGVAAVGIFTIGDRTHVMVSMFLYGPDADNAAEGQRDVWERWLRGVFAVGSVAT